MGLGPFRGFRGLGLRCFTGFRGSRALGFRVSGLRGLGFSWV